MSGFPKIPFFKGDTDGDESIHLNSKVGPAKPLPLKKTDKEILKILNENDDDDNEFNSKFELFKKGLLSFATDREKLQGQATEEQIGNDDGTHKEHSVEPEGNEGYEDSFDEDTEVEDEDQDQDQDYREEEAEEQGEPAVFNNIKHIKRTTESLIPPPFQFSITYVIVVFQLFLILLIYWHNKKSTTITNYQELNLKFNEIDYEIEKISKFNQDLLKNQDLILNNLNELSNNLNSKFDIISNKFNNLNNENVNHFKRYETIKQEFNNLSNDVKNFKVISNYSEFDEKLVIINSKLEELTEISSNFEEFKTKVLKDLIEILPNYLPIYIKNDKIHYIPEFNKFLYNFIDSYYKESNNWDEFWNKNKQSIANYVNSLVDDNPGISKEYYEKLLNEKLNENNQLVYDKLNQLIERNNSTNIKITSDNIMLDNLMDIFSKGAINTNYADYKLGSRILGFLTTNKNDKSLNRKIFLGWYDYLTSSSPSLKDLKSNANNILIDNDDIWECTENNCSIGIRLSSPIILTDLIIKQSSDNSIVNIYIKPNTKREYDEVIKYLSDFRISFTKSNNKYLSKFIKVRSIELNKSINHIKLPISLVNLRIPTKDIYFEFNHIKLKNIKAYGINELNSHKYNNEFNMLIDSLKEVEVLE